jgi:myo-inositol-1(or 4)-monophosphatase
MAEPLRMYRDFAVETARAAGDVTLRHFQRDGAVAWKPDHSPVTATDREAEALIRRRIEQSFPDHDLIGEEHGAVTREGSTHRWIIDPIDGTRAFVRGVPFYAVLMGLEIEGRVRVGVAHFPALNETISAATGEGCDWNGRPARVSTIASLRDGIVVHWTSASYPEPGKAAAWKRLRAAAGYCAGWADAYAYLLVATGRVEVAIDPEMREWDCAAFVPILEEAGGYFGDWSGNETIYAGEALATTRTLLPEVLRILGGGDVRR